MNIEAIDQGGESSSSDKSIQSDDDGSENDDSQAHLSKAINQEDENNSSVSMSSNDVPSDSGKSRSQRPTRECTKRKPKEWWIAPKANIAKALSARIIPLSYKSAVSPENVDFWTPGIEKEHQCLIKNKTWELVERRAGMHVLPSKYVFRVKNGGPKARVVLLGNLQIFGLDYVRTFSPVVKMVTIRTILAIATALGWDIDQMDVVTAFLNGDLNEIIFMEIPEGLRNESNKNMVCKLLKAIYGLKQAPRQWYAKMHHFLVDDLGFTSSINDPCLYTRKTSSGITVIGLYVDDLLITGSSRSEIDKIKGELSSKFEMKNLGEASTILGIQIQRHRASKKLFISQNDYAIQVLHRFCMQDSKPVLTPMDRGGIPSDASESLDKNIPYRQAVGSLMYLMISTRPDIAFAIRCLSQYSENPEEKHWSAVKRVFRYICGTVSKGILYDGSKGLKPLGYSDSDYAGCKESRKSTSAFIFLLSGGAVSWKSKKQTCVATSSCEAEYVACCLATKEAIWLSRIVSDILCSEICHPISIGVDNNGAIDMAYNAVINDRSKHISVQYHFVRESLSQNLVTLRKESSTSQLADPLTKPLDRVLHQRMTRLQGIFDPSRSNIENTSLRGSDDYQTAI